MGSMATPASAAALAQACADVSDYAAGSAPAGQEDLNGQRYMRDAKGGLFPIEMVKPQHRLQDESVRALMAEAEAVAAKLKAFKDRAFDQVTNLQQLLEQQYKVKVGGAKGNVSLFSYDGLLRIQVQIADLIKFGPELQIAKSLIDECAREWVEGARVELKAIVMDAFEVDKEGKLSTGKLLRLRTWEISDERWENAMKAIAESIQVIGSKRYIRFARRLEVDAPWREVSLNMATA